MGGGKGGGAKLPPEIEEAARTQLGIGEERFALGFPLIQEGANQARDVLSGGVGGFGPAIRHTLEQARSTQSAGLTQLREDLTRRGITGSAFNEAMAAGRMGAEQAVAGVPYEFTRPVLETASGETFGLVPQGLQGIQGAASAGAAGAQPGRQSGGAAGALGGAASGAMAGAPLGPWGMAAGAVLGGVSGAK